MRFNHPNKQVGHLFQGRFKAILVDKDAYFLELCRYIVLNPVRAGLADDPADFTWSSYRPMLGITPSPECRERESVLEHFGVKRKQAREAYQRFVMNGIERASPLMDVRGQCLLGGDDFVERHCGHIKRGKESREIPRAQRFIHRPSLEDLFDQTGTRGKRNQAMIAAHLDYGYTQQAISRHLGMHYTTVSRVITKAKGVAKKSKSKT